MTILRKPAMRRWSLLWLPLVLLAAAVPPRSARAADADEKWTSVASAGTVDEVDRDIARFGNFYVDVTGAVAAGDVVIRYNVVPTDGLTAGGPFGLKVLYTDRDNDDGDGFNDAEVVVRLKKAKISGAGLGVITTLLTFDSDSEPAAAGWQSATEWGACSVASFDFNNYAYYVEATIIKRVAGTAAALGAVQIVGGCLF